jgi:hypothetical protein
VGDVESIAGFAASPERPPKMATLNARAEAVHPTAGILNRLLNRELFNTNASADSICPADHSA